jgi:hypothetical protein
LVGGLRWRVYAPFRLRNLWKNLNRSWFGHGGMCCDERNAAGMFTRVPAARAFRGRMHGIA